MKKGKFVTSIAEECEPRDFARGPCISGSPISIRPVAIIVPTGRHHPPLPPYRQPYRPPLPIRQLGFLWPSKFDHLSSNHPADMVSTYYPFAKRTGPVYTRRVARNPPM